MFSLFTLLFKRSRNHTYQLFDGRYIDLYKIVQMEQIADLKMWAMVLVTMLTFLISAFLINA